MIPQRLTKVHKSGSQFKVQLLLRCNKSSSSEDHQYLKKKSIPTYHFQPSLPRLPIPELPKTCARYLRALNPILKPEELNEVEKIVNSFGSQDGPQLQKELLDRDSKNKHTSYISKPWFETYLKDRKPLPINYNPFLVFIDDPKPEYNAQLIRATNLVISSLRFKNSLQNQILEPEVFHLNPQKSDTNVFRTVTGLLPSSVSWYGAYLFKAYPLDMSQYGNLFNTTRIPEVNMDRLYHNDAGKHILVMCGGNFYTINVIDDNGIIIGGELLASCLKHILETNKPSKNPVGVLTAGNRDTWAKERKHLESIGNNEILSAIDDSIFNLVLDDTSTPPTDMKSLIQDFLHSDGLNRWFDKSFSLIVNKKGVAGLNFEHSWGDGVAVLRYFNDIYQDSVERPAVHPSVTMSSDISDKIRPLVFKTDENVVRSIEEAKQKYESCYKSLDINFFEFHNFGRNLCKKHKISPDLIMQLGFQVAHYNLNRKNVATYESCSTSAFKHGRTETMRPCTVETKKFCDAINSTHRPSNDQLRAMIAECSTVHVELIKEAAMGQGFDRHLFALRLLAEEHGKVHDLFKHRSYATMNHFILSTSTLSSDIVSIGAFGPVVQDGFGIGYSMRNDYLGAIITSYRGGADGSGFNEKLHEALTIVYDILK